MPPRAQPNQYVVQHSATPDRSPMETSVTSPTTMQNILIVSTEQNTNCRTPTTFRFLTVYFFFPCLSSNNLFLIWYNSRTMCYLYTMNRQQSETSVDRITDQVGKDLVKSSMIDSRRLTLKEVIGSGKSHNVVLGRKKFM